MWILGQRDVTAFGGRRCRVHSFLQKSNESPRCLQDGSASRLLLLPEMCSCLAYWQVPETLQSPPYLCNVLKISHISSTLSCAKKSQGSLSRPAQA